MKTVATHAAGILLLLATPLLAVQASRPRSSDTDVRNATSASVPVYGTAVHFFSTAIVHSQEATADGMIQRSTDIIKLTGDLNGYLLYHPTSTFDYVSNTLVNSGTQIFSGTVLDSRPILLHDDRFRFQVDLATGATTGEVHLSRSSDAPDGEGWFDCDLVVTGTGVTPAGDNTSDYTGSCTARGTAARP